MNSKKLFIFIFLFTLYSCGVKAPPLTYPETVVDSYVKGYTGADPTPEELARAKDKKPIDANTVPAKIPTLIPQP